MFFTSFLADDSLLSQKYLFLVFEGIDTIGSIYLNGVPIVNPNNMHRTWRLLVRNLLKSRSNEICVKLHSPLKAIEQAQKEYFLTENADTISGFSNLRKAHYMFGWDWGPTLPDMGLWKPVYIEYGDFLPVVPFRVHQEHLSDGSVKLEVITEDLPEAPLHTVARLRIALRSRFAGQ